MLLGYRINTWMLGSDQNRILNRKRFTVTVRNPGNEDKNILYRYKTIEFYRMLIAGGPRQYNNVHQIKYI